MFEKMDFEKIKSKIVDSENIQDFESAKSEANKFLSISQTFNGGKISV
jgi:hypothetical protein